LERTCGQNKRGLHHFVVKGIERKKVGRIARARKEYTQGIRCLNEKGKKKRFYN